MKKIVSLLIVFTMLAAAVPSFAASDYSDVPSNHWAHDYIERVSDKKWVEGYPDGTFHPNNSITRAEALTVFAKFLGLELSDVTMSSYYDVDVNSWYAPYVEAGKELLPERMSIQGKIPFQPTMPITREDAIYALVKALGYDSMTTYADQSVLNMFSDKNSISSNVKAYVATAVSQELVNGRNDGTIGAQDPLTRAEFATLLYKASFAGFNVSSNAKLHSVSIEPSVKKELNVGESFTIKATALYSDNSTKAYTNINPYNADDNGVVSINKNTITAIKSGTCEIRFNDSNLKDKAITVIVNKNDSVPSIVIDAYKGETEEESITVTGKVTDDSDSEITLKCNGEKVYVKTNGKFSADLTLKTGINEFEFVAVNEFGNKATKTITIERTAAKADDEKDDDKKSEDSDKDKDNTGSGDSDKPNGGNTENTGSGDKDNEKSDGFSGNGENFSMDTALQIDINSKVKDSITFSIDETNVAKLKERWYKIDVPSPCKLTLAYLSENMAVDAYLCSKDGESAGSAMFYTKSSKTESWYLLGGTYYIKIVSRNASYGEYTLLLNAELQNLENSGITPEYAIPVELNKRFEAGSNPIRYIRDDGTKTETSTQYFSVDIPKEGMIVTYFKFSMTWSRCSQGKVIVPLSTGDIKVVKFVEIYEMTLEELTRSETSGRKIYTWKSGLYSDAACYKFTLPTDGKVEIYSPCSITLLDKYGEELRYKDTYDKERPKGDYYIWVENGSHNSGSITVTFTSK